MFAYFVDRPILAGAISFLITLIGAVAGLSLPTAQFPQISPPIITVEATYPGASAQQAYEAIAIPLDQEINGAQNLIYIYSFSNTDGSVVLYATFAVGSDLNAAAADVLTRANRAEARLPQAVVAVRRKSMAQFRSGLVLQLLERQFLAQVLRPPLASRPKGAVARQPFARRSARMARGYWPLVQSPACRPVRAREKISKSTGAVWTRRKITRPTDRPGVNSTQPLPDFEALGRPLGANSSQAKPKPSESQY